jgi:hypothetical protein
VLSRFPNTLSDFDSLTESNLDRQRPCNLLFSQKTMLSLLVSIIASCAILVGFAFILSKTVPSMPDKVCRFVFLFVLCVPLNFVVNYVNVWTLGYHKMGWTGSFIIALLFATWGTFWPPQPHNSNTL